MNISQRIGQLIDESLELGQSVIARNVLEGNADVFSYNSTEELYESLLMDELNELNTKELETL